MIYLGADPIKPYLLPRFASSRRKSGFTGQATFIEKEGNRI